MDEITWRDITIAWARPPAVRGFAEDDLAAMGESQVARYRALDPVRAEGFLAGRALLRQLILRLGGASGVTLDSACPRCGRDHGVPRTRGFVLSVSHAHDLVAVAVSRGSAPMAIDVEHAASSTRVAELAPLFAPRPAPDLAEWTRIEAAVKADGRGLAIDPADVRLQAETVGAFLQEWTAELPGRASRLPVMTLAGPPGYTLSAARG